VGLRPGNIRSSYVRAVITCNYTNMVLKLAPVPVSAGYQAGFFLEPTGQYEPQDQHSSSSIGVIKSNRRSYCQHSETEPPPFTNRDGMSARRTPTLTPHFPRGAGLRYPILLESFVPRYGQCELVGPAIVRPAQGSWIALLLFQSAAFTRSYETSPHSSGR
jgi:hypothetical protein